CPSTPHFRSQGRGARAVLRRAGDDEYRGLPYREAQRCGRAAVFLPAPPWRGALRRRYLSAARRFPERRPGRRRHAAEPPPRGLYPALPGAVLVDPSAIQWAACAVSRRLLAGPRAGMTTPDPAATGASSGERAGGRETAADAAELSLARFRAPRYWPIWLLVAAMKLTAHLPYAVQRVLGRLLGAVLRVVSRRRR